jgi:FixJ family two-component response regulator
VTPRPTRIALVDDDESVRRALTRLLRCAGYDVETFATGEAFLGSPSMAALDCALVDVRMPGETGLALVSALRAARITLPVILMTGDAEVGLVEKAERLGAVAVLAKPLAYADVVATIDTAVARRYAGADGPPALGL